jgi:putative RecB family exonuclease
MPETLSASSLQLYLTCSLKWRFQYIDRLPRLSISVQQVFGTSIHAALNWLHRERKRGTPPPLSDVLRVFEADWYAQTNVTGVQQIRLDNPGDGTMLLYKGRELLSLYYHLPAGPVRESELPFTLPIIHPATGEALDVPLRGFEFKTAQKAPPITNLPDDLQLSAYAYAHDRLFGRPPREIRKIALVRTKIPKIETQVTGRGARDFARLFHLGQEVLNGIRASVFIPNRGCWLCADCEYRQDCDEWTGNHGTPDPPQLAAAR